MVIVFLGRSVDGILNDARRSFNDQNIVVIRRDDDQLTAPEGLETRTVSGFCDEMDIRRRPLDDEKFLVVANGGTISQLVPVLKALRENGRRMEVYDLQRDGVIRLW